MSTTVDNHISSFKIVLYEWIRGCERLWGRSYSSVTHFLWKKQIDDMEWIAFMELWSQCTGCTYSCPLATAIWVNRVTRAAKHPPCRLARRRINLPCISLHRYLPEFSVFLAQPCEVPHSWIFFRFFWYFLSHWFVPTQYWTTFQSYLRRLVPIQHSLVFLLHSRPLGLWLWFFQNISALYHGFLCRISVPDLSMIPDCPILTSHSLPIPIPAFPG